MTDTFRRTYVPLSATNKERIDAIKLFATDLANQMTRATSPSRELSLAMTNLEQAVMWATKHFSAPERQLPADPGAYVPGRDGL